MSNYISGLLLESYREVVKDESYNASLEEEFRSDRHKYDSLMRIFNADLRVRAVLAKKLDVSEEDMSIFLKVLRNT